MLTKPSGADAVDVVTIVEWADDDAMQAAKAAMHASYERERFDPASVMQSLGVRADIGTYLPA